MIRQIVKHSLTVLLAVLILAVASLSALALSGGFSGGSGTESDPYRISSRADLAELASLVNTSGTNATYGNAWYILTDDIGDGTSANAYGYGGNGEAIGNNSYKFNGHFNGQGHQVDLAITATSSWNELGAGLFGSLSGGAVIENLTVSGNVSGSSSNSNAYVGGLAAANLGGSIRNCSSSCNATGSGNTIYVGSLVGYMSTSGTISNCYASGTAGGTASGGSASANVGGLVGYNYYSSIRNCYALGAVSGSGTTAYIGGLVGCNYNSARINNCYATGAVSGSGTIGGLVGNNDNYASISYGYWRNDAGPANGVGSGDGSGATGMSTADMQLASGQLGALIDLLNDNRGVNSIWCIASAGEYPSFVTHWQQLASASLSGSGSGSADNPFRIYDGADLAALENIISDTDADDYDEFGTGGEKALYFRLEDDIDLAGYLWLPLNISAADEDCRIVIDGNNKTISNLQVRESTQTAHDVDYNSIYSSALFSELYYAEVKDLTIFEPMVVAAGYTNTASVLAGYANHSKIVNVHISEPNLTVNSSPWTIVAGGLVGYAANNSSITDCSVSGGTVKSEADAYDATHLGGLVGYAYQSAIISCWADTAVELATENDINLYASGLVATMSAEYEAYFCLLNSYSRSDVTVNAGTTESSVYAGGLVGYLEDTAVNNYYLPQTGGGVSVTTGGDTFQGELFGFVSSSVGDYDISRNYLFGDVEDAIGNYNGATMSDYVDEVADAAALLTKLNDGIEKVQGVFDAHVDTGFPLFPDGRVSISTWVIDDGDPAANDGYPIYGEADEPDTPSRGGGGSKPYTPPTRPFDDVLATDWFDADVMYVYEKGLMEGTAAREFSPYLSTSRAMIATILWRLAGEPSGTGSFDDVAAGKWYTDAIAWAAEQGIVEGYGNGNFGPNNPITREQFAAILYRYAQYKGYDVTAQADLSGFSDADSISGYAEQAVKWAVAVGLLEGSNGKLNPGGQALRSQSAAILHRFVEGA